MKQKKKKWLPPTNENKKYAIEADPQMVQMLDLADKDLKKAMINMLKEYNGKSGKHILTVKEFQ